MLINNIINKIKNTGNKLTIFISVFVSLQFMYSIAKPYLDNSALSRFKRLEKNLEIATKALDAELDIDKYIFNKYHLSLFHSNENEKGQFKFSYIKHKGDLYEAKEDVNTGHWMCKKEGKFIYIVELLK